MTFCRICRLWSCNSSYFWTRVYTFERSLKTSKSSEAKGKDIKQIQPKVNISSTAIILPQSFFTGHKCRSIMLARGLWVSLQFYIQLQNFVFLVLFFNLNTLSASFSLVRLKIERELIICIAYFLFLGTKGSNWEIRTKLKNLNI